ncbi:MAG: hypothetical protein DMG14_13830 [Acidobacteria bacterium]|nr:MAG: hypothetical protein DMG14_13830 [Acidobacteriota bacterium]
MQIGRRAWHAHEPRSNSRPNREGAATAIPCRRKIGRRAWHAHEPRSNSRPNREGAATAIPCRRIQTAFASGDRLVLIMDGITEAMNDQNEEFGEDRLIDLLLQYRHMGAAELQKTVIDTVASFARQALQDDATLMIIAMH